MGFVLWYRLTLYAPGPVRVPVARVTNDVASGGYLLDADITIPMLDGARAGEFRISVTNLPAPVVDAVKAAQALGADGTDPMTVGVELGYFDHVPLLSPPGDVLLGAIESVVSTVSSNGDLVTELRGHDLAAFRMLRFCMPRPYSPGGPVTPAMCVSHILSAAGGVQQQGMVMGGLPRTDYALPVANGLASLGLIARWANARFSVRDNAVVWDTPGASVPGPVLDPATNLVRLDDEQAVPLRTRECPARDAEESAVEASARMKATVLGDPSYRPGQTLTVAGAVPPRQLYAQRVTHSFSTATGYICDLELTDRVGGPLPAPGGVHGVVERIRDVAENRHGERPAIDIGEVESYEPASEGKHLATLHYGQDPEADIVAPSVESPVSHDVQLHHKPIAAPFAWHKCGLIVPAYPGQRALLAHNRSNANDAVVAGYLWSDEPAMDRPAGEPGDWWLCLPTQIRGGQPAGKGANDLTDASGLRAIQVKSLRIDVGEDRMAAVGERPAVPDATTFKIDHAGGTAVTINDDGSVELTTDSKTITVTNGTSSLTLDGSNVELTNGSVTIALSGGTVEVR